MTVEQTAPFCFDDRSRARLEAVVGSVLGHSCQISPWRRGMQYTVLRVRAGEKTFVLRVANQECVPEIEGVVDFSTVVAREAALHARLAAAGVPVAALITWASRGEEAEHSWMLFEHVSHDEVRVLSDAQQRQLGAVTRQIHSVKITDAGFIGPGGSGRPAALLERVRQRYRFVENVLSLPSWAAIEPVMSWAILADESEPRTLVHMDLRPENLCFRGDVLAAVLDLTNGMVASAFAELGRLHAYESLTPSFLHGYGITKLDDRDELRIRAHSVFTLAMLVSIAGLGVADQSLLTTVGPRLTAEAMHLGASALSSGGEL